MDHQELIIRLQRLDAACLCDADKTLPVMDSGIRPVGPGLSMAGRARTVSCRLDFLTVIQALADAEAGEVLVVDGGKEPVALAGELFSTEAERRGLAGMVFDGGIRDSARIRALNFPVFSRWITPRAGGSSRLFKTQCPVICGGVRVNPGDIVFGDDDGIVVFPPDKADVLLSRAEEIQRTEEAVLRHMAGGRGLLDRLNFREHRNRIEAGKPSLLKFLD